MADVRIKDLATEIAEFADDDFAEFDGATNGSRKMRLGRVLAGRRNALAPRGGVAIGSVAGTGVWSTLTGQNVLVSECSVVVTFLVPATAPASVRGVWGLSSSVSDFAQLASMRCRFPSSGNLEFILKNASNQDARYRIDNFCANFGGKIVQVAWVRATSGAWVVYVNGVAQTLTTVDATASYQDSITSTFFGLGYNDSSSSLRTAVYSATIYNVALTAAEVIEIFELGGAVPQKFKFGSFAEQLVNAQDRSFGSAGTGNWGSLFGSGTSIANPSNALELTTPASGSGGTRLNVLSAYSSPVLGGKCRVSGVFTLVSGAAPTSLYLGLGGVPDAATITPTGVPTTFTREAEVVGGSVNQGAAVTSGAGLTLYTNNGNGSVIRLDDISMLWLGAVLHLPLDDGLGFQLQDVSTNRLHALASATGVLHLAPLYGPARVRYLTDGTTTAQKLCGGTTLPANCQIIRIRARAQSGTPNIILGSASGGSQIVASVALSTTWKDLTIALTGGIVSALTDIWTTISTANVVEIDITWEPLSN